MQKEGSFKKAYWNCKMVHIFKTEVSRLGLIQEINISIFPTQHSPKIRLWRSEAQIDEYYSTFFPLIFIPNLIQSKKSFLLACLLLRLISMKTENFHFGIEIMNISFFYKLNTEKRNENKAKNQNTHLIMKISKVQNKLKLSYLMLMIIEFLVSF